MTVTFQRAARWSARALPLAIAVGRRVIDPLVLLTRSLGEGADRLERTPRADVRPGSASGPLLPELTEFVHDNYDRLIRLAGLVCRNAADAEDAVQSALERAWRNQGALRDPDRVKPWLDRIVVREAVRITRSREGLVGRLLRRTDDEIDVSIDPVDPRAADGAHLADLRIAFARLSAEQRAVTALHLYAGYSVAETAEIVGAPLETVRSRLRLARQRLRVELDPT